MIRERNGNFVEGNQLSLGFLGKFVGVNFDMINYTYLALFYTLKVCVQFSWRKKTW